MGVVRARGAHGYVLVMRYGQLSECSECDKTMQLWVGQCQGRVVQVGCCRCGTASWVSQGGMGTSVS